MCGVKSLPARGKALARKGCNVSCKIDKKSGEATLPAYAGALDGMNAWHTSLHRCKDLSTCDWQWLDDQVGLCYAHAWMWSSVVCSAGVKKAVQCRRAIVGNALAVPVACAALTAGMAVVGTAAACLTGYAAYKSLSFGFGHIKGCASW